MRKWVADKKMLCEHRRQCHQVDEGKAQIGCSLFGAEQLCRPVK